MKNINAGDLRHRVTLNRNTNPAVPNAAGQVKTNYQPLGTYYSLVECLGGVEDVNGNQLKGVLRYKVTLRAASGPIYPNDSMLWNGHTLNVVAAKPDPFGIMIEVDAIEKGPQ